jgi:RimJ/RimL family protein N-acetyltransferase
MQHSLSIDGYGYRLRPVTFDDAQFIIEVRTENAERTKYIHSISTDISLQLQWLENYFKTPNDYYFVIENKSSMYPEGLISIYNILDNKGESGRWVIKQNSLSAVESWYLLYRLSFEILNLEEVFCHIITENKPIIAFHKSVKQKIRKMTPKSCVLDGIEYDEIEFYIDRDYFFSTVQPRLEKITKSVFGKMN